jgi:hypothetical protein
MLSLNWELPMRFTALLLVLIGSLTATVRADAAPPILNRTLVVSGQGYFPVALRLRGGRIGVVLRGGGPHLSIHGRLDIVFSADEGKTWTKPAVVVDSPVDDRNPAFGQAKDGTLVVAFWRTARYTADGQYTPDSDKPVNTWVTRSKDAGKTWSDPAQIDVSDVGWGSPYGRMITLTDGTMLMNVYAGQVRRPGEKVAAETENSYVYRSTDSGVTWRRLSAPGSNGYNETALLETSAGILLAAMRTAKEGAVAIARSTNGGRTWSMPEKLTPAAVHPADLLLLPDGRVLMTCGDRRGPFGVRAVAGDASGKFNWNASIPLVTDAINSDCGYPSSVPLKDGRVLTVYYATGSKENPDWGTHCGAVTWSVR